MSRDYRLAALDAGAGARNTRFASRAGSFLAWNGSWNGGPDNPLQRGLSVRFPVSSVLLVRSVDDAVVMARRRSTVRFRNGAPGHGKFSNIFDTRHGTSPGDAPQLP